jgi:hypothetical protein
MARKMKVPALPADAVGFIAERHDKECRLSIYRPDGTISNTFGHGETFHAVAAACERHGMRCDMSRLTSDRIVILFRA